MAITAAIVLFLVFGLLLVLSVPISMSIGLASIAAILTTLPWEMAIFTASQRFVTGIDNFSLLAVPFFILAGILMTNGGIAERLVNFAKVLVGRMPGSLAHTNVVGNMLFGSIAGSSVASAVAIGGVMGPMQKKEGYDPRFAAAVNIASAPTGLIIPPSQTLIIYSLASGGTSIAALFIAGYLPGILWGFICMIVAFVIAKRSEIPTTRKANSQNCTKNIYGCDSEFNAHRHCYRRNSCWNFYSNRSGGGCSCLYTGSLADLQKCEIKRYSWDH